MSIACYTAVAGAYDPLRPAPPIRGVDFIAFVDDLEAYRGAQGWELRPLPERNWSPRLRAKEPKCLPQVFLPEYEETIWMDASHQIINRSFAREMMDVAFAGDIGFAVHKHPWRVCIYDEAAASLELAKYQPMAATIKNQVANYRATGYPERAGLWACGSIARTRDDLYVDRLCEMWWEQCRLWTIQDQLSFPVVFRMLGVKPTTFPHHQVYHNPWFRIHNHPRNDE